MLAVIALNTRDLGNCNILFLLWHGAHGVTGDFLHGGSVTVIKWNKLRQVPLLRGQGIN